MRFTVSFTALLMTASFGICAQKTNYVQDFKKLANQAKVNSETYWNTILESETPSIVRVIGKDCSACTSTWPIYRDVAKSYSDKINFIEISYSDNSRLLKSYKIKSIPTFLYISQDGVHQLKQHASVTRQKLIDGINTHFSFKKKSEASTDTIDTREEEETDEPESEEIEE